MYIAIDSIMFLTLIIGITYLKIWRFNDPY